MKINKHLLKWREQKNKNSSASVTTDRTESLSYLYTSLDNERDKKAIQLRAEQLEKAKDIQDYQELEELAQNFDFLSLRRFLSSDYNSSTFTLIKYETSNSYEKLLAGFDFSYEYYDSKFKYLMVQILLVIFAAILGVIGVMILVAIGAMILFSIANVNLIKLIFILVFIKAIIFLAACLIATKHTDPKNIENSSFFKKEIYEFNQIKLPELRLLFREFEAMKLNPILILHGTPWRLEVEIELTKGADKFGQNK